MSAFSVLSDTPGETVEQIVLRVGIVPAPAFFQSIALEEERIPLQFWAATGRERARMRISRFMDTSTPDEELPSDQAYHCLPQQAATQTLNWRNPE